MQDLSASIHVRRRQQAEAQLDQVLDLDSGDDSDKSPPMAWAETVTASN
jgi:hypothetical protein